MLREVAQRKDLRPLKRASARLSESVLCALSPSRPSRPGGGTARPHTSWILCLHARLLAETRNFPNPHSDAFIVRRDVPRAATKCPFGLVDSEGRAAPVALGQSGRLEPQLWPLRAGPGDGEQGLRQVSSTSIPHFPKKSEPTRISL